MYKSPAKNYGIGWKGNNMKFELNVHPDFIDDWSDEEDKPFLQYTVTAKREYPYRDDNNYRRTGNHGEYEHSSDTLDGLYEIMARDTIDYRLMVEKDGLNKWEGYDIEDYKVTFSDIYVKVQPYEEFRMKATETYQKLGAERDRMLEQKKIITAAEAKRTAEYQAKQKEEFEKREFERLSKKFNK